MNQSLMTTSHCCNISEAMATPIGCGSTEDIQNSTHSPRWGEYYGKQHVSDGLSRFRNNFSACHQVPLEGGKAKFDGYMIPKPNNVDSSKVGQTTKTYRTSSWDRAARFEVFPKNDPARTDEKGEYVLQRKTREALGKFHRTLFCTSRYGMLHPEPHETSDDSVLPDDTLDSPPLYDVRGSKRVRFADDYGYNLEIKPTCRADLEMISNPAKWPRFEKENYEDANADLCSYHVDPIQSEWNEQVKEDDDVDTGTDMNQNYHLLTASIYNYRLPSALHLPDECFLPEMYLQPQQEEKEPENKTPQTMKFQRPTYPASLIGEMHTAKREMKLMDERLTPITRTIPNFTSASLPLIEDDWAKYSSIEKLKLNDRSGFRKRFHLGHPETVPDLRDHTTYSKKVFFEGFNSHAFRG